MSATESTGLTFQCRLCGLPYRQLRALLKHLQIAHGLSVGRR